MPSLSLPPSLALPLPPRTSGSHDIPPLKRSRILQTRLLGLLARGTHFHAARARARGCERVREGNACGICMWEGDVRTHGHAGRTHGHAGRTCGCTQRACAQHRFNVSAAQESMHCARQSTHSSNDRPCVYDVCEYASMRVHGRTCYAGEARRPWGPC